MSPRHNLSVFTCGWKASERTILFLHYKTMPLPPNTFSRIFLSLFIVIGAAAVSTMPAPQELVEEVGEKGKKV